MRLISFFMMLTLFLALFFSLTITSMPARVDPRAEPQRGPRAPGMEIMFYPTVEAMYARLLAGEIEYMTTKLSAAQYEDAITRAEIMVAPTTTLNIVNEAIQSNYTMPTQPDRRNPMNDVNFRKAVLHLVDKDYYIETIYEGFAERIDVPIAAPSRGWMNESLIGNNYPYPFSPVLADQRMTDPAVYGAPENGWYDYDNDTIRNYPLDWPGVEGELGVRDEPNMLPLQYWIYDDPPERYEQAHHLAEQLRAIGIPVDEHVAPFELVNDQCWCAYDYHLSSDGWNVGRFPTYQWFFFASYLWMPGLCGANAYTGGDDEPWAAEVDATVEAVRYAKTAEESKHACLYAQYLIMDKYALWVPIRSTKGFYAYRNLLGVVPMHGVGLWNVYTWMNAYRTDDPTKPIRIGMVLPRYDYVILNPLYVIEPIHQMLMEPLWDNHITLNPYNLMKEQPGLCQDWQTTPWYDDGVEKTLCKFWLNKEASYIEPITGNVLSSLTSQGLEFGIWYVYQTLDLFSQPRLDLHHIRRDPNNPYYIEYYWDRTSFLFYLDGWSIPLTIFHQKCKQYPLVEDPDNRGTPGPAVKVFVEGVNMTTPDHLTLPHQTSHAPVEVVSIVEEGCEPLTPADIYGDNDYEIVKGRIHIYKNITDGTKITVTYWAKGPSARGTTPGQLPWYEVILGTGPWYMTSFDILTGVTYSANRHHMWTTPSLGETDWYWHWIEGPKPRNGYMKINIYDVTLATGAYGTQGRYHPDAAFNPTADLAPSSDGLLGKIDIYDLVTVTAQYGTYFWSSEPNPPP